MAEQPQWAKWPNPTPMPMVLWIKKLIIKQKAKNGLTGYNQWLAKVLVLGLNYLQSISAIR